MPREVSGIRCLALGSGDRLFIGTVDNNIWCTFLNGDLDSPLKESGSKLVKVMEVSNTSFVHINIFCLHCGKFQPNSQLSLTLTP